MDMKIDKYVIIASLNSEPTCKLINRIQSLCLLISGLPGLALRMHVELLGKASKPHNSTNILKALPGKLSNLVFSDSLSLSLGFRQSEIQTSLLRCKDKLEYQNFACNKWSHSTYQVVNNKGADLTVQMCRLD